MNKHTNLDNKPVAQVVSERIQRLIIDGGLKPGEKLPAERLLSTEFNISRMSLRKGISLLAETGILEVKKDGTYVCNVLFNSLAGPINLLISQHPEALEDALDLWLLLGKEAITIAIERAANPDQILVNHFYEQLQEKFRSQCSFNEILTAYYDFHIAIIDCSHNIILSTVLSEIISLTRAFNSETPSKAQVTKFQYLQKESKRAFQAKDIESAHGLFSQTIEFIKLIYSQKKRGRSKTNKIKGADVPIITQELFNDLRSQSDGNVHLSHLIKLDLDITYSIIELRMLLERNSASLAAKCTDGKKKAHLEECLSKLLSDEHKNNPETNAYDDYSFHLAIASMSNNLAIVYLMGGLYNLLSTSIRDWLLFFDREIGDISIIEQQHIDIADSILSEDSNKASKAMEAHLQYVVGTLKSMESKNKIMNIALRRLHFINKKLGIDL